MDRTAAEIARSRCPMRSGGISDYEVALELASAEGDFPCYLVDADLSLARSSGNSGVASTCIAFPPGVWDRMSRSDLRESGSFAVSSCCGIPL